MDTHAPSFVVAMLLGSLGALAPEIVRLYEIRQSEWKFPFSYYVISFLYAGLGGVMAVALHASTWYSAVYVGATLPTFISALTKNRKKRQNIVKASQDIRPTKKKTLLELIRSHSDALFR